MNFIFLKGFLAQKKRGSRVVEETMRSFYRDAKKEI
jgi:hypothetical protein